MDSDTWQLIERLFYEALEKTEDRAAYESFLEKTRTNYPELVDPLLVMLQSLDEIESFMETSPLPSLKKLLDLAENGPTREEILPEQIGAYAIIRKLGQGQAAAVYLARQEQPQRMVALKLFHHTAFLPEQVRFQTEYQAQALMNHDHITRLFEVGTDQERPYLVMEYVPGMPITDYCRQERLTITERVQLMVDVCEGVAHAHQNAVLHRDLKPSNILVIPAGNPSVKIIDFSIAKIESVGSANETAQGTFMGTPAYMSPEQAGISSDHPDTRTDIFSIGAVLYELLTDRPPLDEACYGKAGHEERIRLIRHRNPTPPSKVAKKAGSFLARSKSPVELDWIVMKALENEKERRYATASELKADLVRFLENQPVLAAPTSKVYRARKLFRRHRLAFLSIGTGFLLLLIGLVAALSGLNQARLESQKTSLALDQVRDYSHFLEELLAAPHPDRDGKSVKVVELLDRAENLLDNEPGKSNALWHQARLTLARSFYGLGLFPSTKRLLDTILKDNMRKDDQVYLDTLKLMGRTHQQLGEYKEARRFFEQTLDLERSVFGESHPRVDETVGTLASLLQILQAGREAENLLRDTLARQKKVLAADHPQVALTLVRLGFYLTEQDQYNEAERLYKEALTIQRPQLGEDHSQTMATQNDLANLYLLMERLQEAEVLYRKLVQKRKRILGSDHPNTISSLHGLARVLFHLDRYSESRTISEEAMEMRVALLGDHHPQTIRTKINHASLLGTMGFLSEAVDMLQDLTNQYRVMKRENESAYLQAMNNLGHFQSLCGYHPEAIDTLTQTIVMKIERLGYRVTTMNSIFTLGEALCRSGDIEASQSILAWGMSLAINHLPASSNNLATYRALVREPCQAMNPNH